MKKQSGMTLISWLITLAIVGFLAAFVMRIFPMYQEYYSVVQVMKSMESDITEKELSKQQVMTLLSKRFNTGYIFNVKKDNIELMRTRDNINIDKIVIDYEVKKPFFAQISLVANFHLEAEAQKAAK